MKRLFETTWTCDSCGQPNFNDSAFCKNCGAPKPARYGRIIKGRKGAMLSRKRTS